MASLQGIDLDSEQVDAKQAFEDVKARVFSGGAAKDSKDILSLQGISAAQSGFGINNGIDYKIADESFSWADL